MNDKPMDLMDANELRTHLSDKMEEFTGVSDLEESNRRLAVLQEWKSETMSETSSWGSEASVVQTELGKRVVMTYRRGCHDYGIGFAAAFFMASSVLGFVILWKQHVPDSLYHTSVIFFVAFAVIGFSVVGVAYTKPVRFYELMEDKNND